MSPGQVIRVAAKALAVIYEVALAGLKYRFGRAGDRSMPFLTFMELLSAISNARIALPNFYDVAVGIANVAARLAVFGLWLGDELGPPTFP